MGQRVSLDVKGAPESLGAMERSCILMEVLAALI